MYGDAEKTFTKMVAQFPDEKEGYFYLERCTSKTNALIKQWRSSSHCWRKGPTAPAQARIELGAVYLLQKDFGQQRTVSRKQLKLDPLNLGARLSLFQALANQKKFDDAFQVFDETDQDGSFKPGHPIRWRLHWPNRNNSTRPKKCSTKCSRPSLRGIA